MCTACVAQGIAYVGGAVGTLRVMAARAEHRRRSSKADTSVVEAAGGGPVAEPSG